MIVERKAFLPYIISPTFFLKTLKSLNRMYIFEEKNCIALIKFTLFYDIIIIQRFLRKILKDEIQILALNN